MIHARLTWNGGPALASVRAAGWDAVKRVAVFFWQKITEALNVSNPRPYLTPSAPGEPPRKRTGFLQRNVLYELDEAAGAARVGVAANAKYGAFLEFGTRRMKARPFVLSTLNKFLTQLRQLAGAA